MNVFPSTRTRLPTGRDAVPSDREALPALARSVPTTTSGGKAGAFFFPCDPDSDPNGGAAPGEELAADNGLLTADDRPPTKDNRKRTQIGPLMDTDEHWFDLEVWCLRPGWDFVSLDKRVGDNALHPGASDRPKSALGTTRSTLE
jgi:hypothetical protein